MKPDLIVGASAGAIKGAYFADDPTLAGACKLEELWRGLRRCDVFSFNLANVIR